MTKKKVVIKVSNMNGRNPKCALFPNCRTQNNRLKALQIAAAVPGLQSLSLKGTDKDVIEVTGEGFDAVDLTNELRKNVGHANLETLDDVKEEKPPKQDEQPAAAPLPTVFVYPSCETEPACCTVM